MGIFYPKNDYNNIYEVDYEQLKTLGIKGIIFDIDNTLVPYDVVEPTVTVRELLTKLKDQGFELCLISNNNETRVNAFNREMGLFAVPRAYKPLKKNILKGLAYMKTKPEETAIIGDQMFTDIWGGNRLGLYTILINPIQDKEEWITKVKRGIEKKVYKRYISKKSKE